MKRIEVSLCGTYPDDSTCPAVSISDTQVTIGENENTVQLKPVEWNKLVDLIKSGELKKV